MEKKKQGVIQSAAKFRGVFDSSREHGWKIQKAASVSSEVGHLLMSWIKAVFTGKERKEWVQKLLWK